MEDYAELRRGVPVAHAIYGVPQTINTSNYVYFLAFEELLKLRPTEDHGKKGDMVAMVTGELSDFWTDNRRAAAPASRAGS